MSLKRSISPYSIIKIMKQSFRPHTKLAAPHTLKDQNINAHTETTFTPTRFLVIHTTACSAPMKHQKIHIG
jgi:hypothetical protein